MSAINGNETALRTAVVTGAARGVGNALVRTLAASGDWHVIAVARKQADVDELNAIDHVEAHLLDLLDADAIEQWGAKISEREAPRGGVDLLANVAAVAVVGSVEDTHNDDWDVTLRTNVVAPAVLSRSLLPALRVARGSVVFVNSGAGERPIANHSVYVASKHALRGFAGSLRLEESANGIRVATVYPGQIATKMLRGIDERLGVEFNGEDYIQPQTVAETIIWIANAGPDVHITNIDLRPRREVSAKFNV